MASGERSRRRLPFWIELPILVVIALVVALVVRQFAVQTFYIPSPSMENTLRVNDQILVNKIIYHLRPPHRGEVIVFEPPASWRESLADKDFVKRLIGLPGDHVVCCNATGQVTINGYALTEPYLYPGNHPSDRRFDVRVPAGRLFVMGDHRSLSGDSRIHLDENSGTIPEGSVVGPAFAIYWPVNHWSGLPVPETFEHIPPPSR
ncbi:signal peptidase I [Fodinicola acaciae]|uniref:signal peptidase I n=1 Tax=Fodinicola acaciae TaxID=2681555 RepID=UPI0013D403BF|nr:signal peptidase I [Fodinicola acaciae]